MNEKEFLEIDETSLPDVKLTKEQKEKAKKRLNSYINRLKHSNPNLNISYDERDIANIKDKLGDRADKVRHSVHEANVLKEMVLKSVDEKEYSTNNDIIYTTFLLGAFKETIVGYVPVYSSTPYYYKIYVTKDSLIIYSFDWFFKVLQRKCYSFNQIEGVGVAPQYLISKEINRECMLIRLVENTEVYGNYYLLINEEGTSDSTIRELCSTITDGGVNEFSKGYFLWHHRRDKLMFILYNLGFAIFGLMILLTI